MGEIRPTLTGRSAEENLIMRKFAASSSYPVAPCERTPMKITPEQVDYVALLGRLTLEPEEKKKYMGQLDDILKYMDMLAEVDTENVEPMIYVSDNAEISYIRIHNLNFVFL